MSLMEQKTITRGTDAFILCVIVHNFDDILRQCDYLILDFLGNATCWVLEFF